MPDIVLPALCDHCIAATNAFAPEAWLSSSTFSVNDSEFEFHLFFLSMANRLLEAGCFETQDWKRISLLLVLASRQRWPEKLCRWLLTAAVASPLCFQCLKE
jgi:hypothetical protein